MNIFKNLFKRKQKTKKEEEKKENECWYNDMYEKGEALRGSTPFGVGGSGNSFENGTTQYVAQK